MPSVRHVTVRPQISNALAHKIRVLVRKVARQYDVPPVYLTAHIRLKAADEARHEVWRIMITEFHMTRSQVADCFDRDRRCARRSKIGV